MKNDIQWTNKSVLAFAGGQDPLAKMEDCAKTTVLNAMDEGWNGPPFDPVSLAKILKLSIRPRSDIPDARTVPTDVGLSIEFNPLRPRGRVRFSIAHEIAHSFFPDCAEKVRNRGTSHNFSSDEWQLEVLCNIGAAELLMPTGSFLELASSDLDIHKLVATRKQYDVSTEALFIRTIKLTSASCAAFCASHDDGAKSFRLDYLIGSQAWHSSLRAGTYLPEGTVVSEANAIGFTATGIEVWGKTSVRVQCIGLAPYPGSVVPRVVGIVAPPDAKTKKNLDISLVIGDALAPRGPGKKIIAHVVPDSTTTWGGGGFASQLRKKFPNAASDFKEAVAKEVNGLRVGQTYRGSIDAETFVFHMVAQRGHGRDQEARIRYASLATCLGALREYANEIEATVHMPRIGTGLAGGSWDVVHDLILEELVRKGISVTVYQLP